MSVMPVKYEEEMKKAYIDYSMSVIVQRALPDVRDGLKPVHRRILYSMKDLSNYPDKPHKKSARIVGDVLGKYHPHGDTSVYDAMVRLAQDFSMLMPLVDGHGNFGSIDGDGAAAMRYTEARMSPLAMELLRDLDVGVVDMKNNFDGTLLEPTVLPAHFPNLLVNGSTGIAVGMATNIPSHNLKEVIDATLAMLDKPDIDTRGLMKYIKGPDFPTGGIISNKDELLSIYESGNGKIKIRAKIEKEAAPGSRLNLIVTEVPYTLSGNKTRVIEEVLKLMMDRKLDEVTEIRDESSKDGLRMVIETKKGTDGDALINKLYKLTRFEDTFGVNLLAICDNKPVSYSLSGLVFEYLKFLKEINRKKLEYELNKLKERKEILDGLIKAVNVIDLIIEAIRGSKSLATVKACLIEGNTEGITFKSKKAEKDASRLLFTERQAIAILALQLQRLVGLEIEKLEKELDETTENIKRVSGILNSEVLFNSYIKDDLLRIKKEFGKKRKTVLENLETVEIKASEPVEEDVYVLIDKFNYLKLIDSASFTRMTNLEEYKSVISIKSTDNLTVFTDVGDFHQIRIKGLTFSKGKDRGEPLDNLCGMGSDRVLLISPLSELSHNILFATSMGLVKLVESAEFQTKNKTIRATKLKDGDTLVKVCPVSEEESEIQLLTRENRELRFGLKEVPVQKRTATGVTGINLNAGDVVTDAMVSEKTGEKKRKRGSKGVAAVKNTP